MKKFVPFVVLGSAFVLAGLPASMMDRVIAVATDGRIRIAAAHGSFWRGDGMLATTGRSRQFDAWRPVAWRIAIAGAGLALRIEENGTQRAQVLFTAHGVELTGLDVDLPVALLAHVIRHPAARAGWRGDARFSSRSVACDWRGICDGEMRIVWHAAGVDIVPDRRFGDYALALRLVAGNATAELGTLAGEIRIAGRGEMTRDGGASFDGTVEGEPEIVDRIPNVMDRNARPTGKSGVIAITFP